MVLTRRGTSTAGKATKGNTDKYNNKTRALIRGGKLKNIGIRHAPGKLAPGEGSYWHGEKGNKRIKKHTVPEKHKGEVCYGMEPHKCALIHCIAHKKGKKGRYVGRNGEARRARRKACREGYPGKGKRTFVCGYRRGRKGVRPHCRK